MQYSKCIIQLLHNAGGILGTIYIGMVDFG